MKIDRESLPITNSEIDNIINHLKKVFKFGSGNCYIMRGKLEHLIQLAVAEHISKNKTL